MSVDRKELSRNLHKILDGFKPDKSSKDSLDKLLAEWGK